ncbi:serine/threonine protein kinase [Streptomyces sp. CB02923]|uniref:protein kinase domain-containing protein n=1 Tax=Streptomyces sp. CB02923 TaxID=1718985 RepID=UPI00093A3939|nr:serine/threonine-protein kinase [Streptomyces sp. CB02923]OKH99947.1 serine/threonine protein kinase [Streptomyces sp. CB02923]
MGEVFAGRYELIDPIGRGGVGAVWRAWDQRRRRYVAAKVLQQSDAHTLLRFVREQAVRIDHPHVLAPASWAADDDKVLFTMDLVHGGSLAHLVGDYGPLPPRLACVLLDQLLSGLTAVHAEGIVHRDIKPANILLESTGTGRPHVRLSDFGISMRKGEPRLTDANYVVGTPGYFAPEQMLGAEPDFPGDLFAVGLVALHLLTGSRPDAQSLIEHFAQHGTPEAPEDIAEPLWQVLANLLQPDPDLRFKTAAGARKALLAAAELLPEATIEDELVEVFDHIGPLPSGFGPNGPLRPRQPKQPKQPGAAPPAPASPPTSTPPPPMSAPPMSPPPMSPPPTSMSDTGSFPLAPPSSGLPAPQHPAAHAPGPEHTPSTGLPGAHTPGAHTPDAATPGAHTPGGHTPDAQQATPHQAAPQQPGPHGHPYAVPQPPTTPPTVPPARPHFHGSPPARPPATRPYTPGHQQPLPPAGRAAVRRHRALPQQRPGPPPKVAVPVIVVALLCIAFGIWALAAS